MRKCRQLVTLFLVALFVLGASGRSWALSPDELSQPEHSALKSFVAWMRVKKYPENIVSKWVQDYMDPVWTNLMMSEIGKKGKNATIVKSFVPPVSIKYVEIVPTDPDVQTIPYDEVVLKEKYKQYFGMNIDIEHATHQVNYLESFGEFEVMNYADGIKLKLNSAAYNKWAKAFICPLYNVDFSGDGANHRKDTVVWNSLEKLGGESVLDTTAVSSCVTFAGNEEPAQGVFHSHAHEWAHAYDQNHHYFDSMINEQGSYGTHGTFSIACNQAISDFSKYGLLMDPLQAYLLEPEGGFDYPELVTGKAYFDHLALLDPCEMPYTKSPDPRLQVMLSVHGEGENKEMIIVASNIGNVPLALVDFNLKLACQGQRKKLLDVDQSVHWLDLKTTINWTFSVKVDAGCNLTSPVVSLKTKGVSLSRQITPFPAAPGPKS